MTSKHNKVGSPEGPGAQFGPAARNLLIHFPYITMESNGLLLRRRMDRGRGGDSSEYLGYMCVLTTCYARDSSDLLLTSRLMASTQRSIFTQSGHYPNTKSTHGPNRWLFRVTSTYSDPFPGEDLTPPFVTDRLLGGLGTHPCGPQ